MVDGVFCCDKCHTTYRRHEPADKLPKKINCSKCGAVQKPRAEYKKGMDKMKVENNFNIPFAVRRKILGDALYYTATGYYSAQRNDPRVTRAFRREYSKRFWRY